MARHERPLDSGDSAELRFAAALRCLRQKAGNPTYRVLAQRAHYSVTALSSAAAGRALPSLSVTLAYVRACGGDVDEWERLWREAAAQLADAAQADRATDDGADDAAAPYPGLSAFQPDDAKRFFGREELTGDLADRLSRRRFVAVFGASGSGKSSLLRAGLLPRLRADAHRGLVVLLTPGPHPLEECAVRLATPAGTTAGALQADIAADPANLHRLARQILAERPSVKAPTGVTITASAEGCIADAERTLHGDLPDWFRVKVITTNLRPVRKVRVRQDRRYTEAVRQWAACMRAAGRLYGSPEESRRAAVLLHERLPVAEADAAETARPVHGPASAGGGGGRARRNPARQAPVRPHDRAADGSGTPAEGDRAGDRANARPSPSGRGRGADERLMGQFSRLRPVLLPVQHQQPALGQRPGDPPPHLARPVSLASYADVRA
ncbi:helix-turn-helix domain-containing protein [Streptomyces lichenis]|uniref:helix-turn-helix domain-containing protein n=1 Tax=Streptomyces lichenis TaxID=2306967 RepID=UPI0027E303C6|nr:helix-turn-helix domain-containing protein [Streptomyces lichenis]